MSEPAIGIAPASSPGFAAEVEACTACGLHAGRTHPVVGSGAGSAGLLILGEAPGADEDRTGLPFVGRSGRLLRRLVLDELGLEGEAITISNLVRCRPPANRPPTARERTACWSFTERQLAFLRPRVVLCVGNTSTRMLLGRSEGITELRGRVYEAHGTVVVPTFHPSAALRHTPGVEAAMRDDLRRCAPYLTVTT